MEFRFDGKVAVVTGAGQGIGYAIAKALAQGGAVTHALSKTQPNLDKLKNDIRVNSVNPTIVMTEMGKKAWADPEKRKMMVSRIPLGKLAEVEDVVRPVLYLLSDKSDMINGATLPIEGGLGAC